MSETSHRDVGYRVGDTTMIGYFCTPNAATTPRPGIVMIHGGFGLAPRIMDNAERLASRGYAVLAADMWGERRRPASPPEFAELIKALADDRPTWLARIDAARDALVAQPEVASGAIAAVGYCFGGSSVLEYARAGRDVAAVVSLHGGLADVGLDWSDCSASTSIQILTGAEDPMAPAADLGRLNDAMTAAGLDWETDVHSGTNHAFTFPDSPNYHEVSDRRSWRAMTRALAEAFLDESVQGRHVPLQRNVP